MNGHNHPSSSIHVFHVGKMRIKLHKGKITKAKETYSPSMQLCGVRDGGNAAAQAVFWQVRKGISFTLAFESKIERNAAIMLARRFAFDVMQLSLAMYNFLELESSKWAYLNRKLEQHHVTMRELHISDCTYANLKSLLSRSDQMPFYSIHEKSASPEAFQKRSRQGIMHQLIMERSATSNISYSNFDFNKNRGIFSIAAAPNFFLSLHLKVLMESWKTMLLLSVFRKPVQGLWETVRKNVTN